MAQRKYSINLKTAGFPMLTKDQTRTTIGLGGSAEGVSDAEDLPQLAYCHNLLPTKTGYHGASYRSKVNANAFLGTSFYGTYMVGIVRIIGVFDELRYLGFDNLGYPYITGTALDPLAPDSDTWYLVGSSVYLPTLPNSDFSMEQVTIATVNKVTHLYFSGLGRFVFVGGFSTLNEVILTGIDKAATLGIVGTAGYMLAYTKDAIAWSSTINHHDFTPSSVTGAGGGAVAGAEGHITYAAATNKGLIIYTLENAISGTYTGNPTYPFKFFPIDRASGLTSGDSIAHERSDADQYVLSKAGIQIVTNSQSEVILEEVTDFLAGSVLEVYDTTINAFVISELFQTLSKKITRVGSRYIIISYGRQDQSPPVYNYALVFDIALKRLGKLLVDHTSVIEYTVDAREVEKESIAFLAADGELRSVISNTTASDTDGVVAVLGRLQPSHTRNMTLLGVEVEGSRFPSEATFNVGDLVYSKGVRAGTSYVDGFADTVDEQYANYKFLAAGKSHNIVITGAFDLTTVLVTYKIDGRR